MSDAMRELFNKAMYEQLSSAKYAVNEIQKQVIIIKYQLDLSYLIKNISKMKVTMLW